MKTYTLSPWVYYQSDTKELLDPNKVGKWMHFFNNESFAAEVCAKAVEEGVVQTAKHNNTETGVACFYLEIDDFEGHRRVIEYFIANDLIRRTKADKLFNISFKLDSQTHAGEYGLDFKGQIKLEELVDLESGEWIYN